MSSHRSSRREFLRHSAGVAAGLGAAGLPNLYAQQPKTAPPPVPQPRAANERIKIGVIGCGLQGRAIMGAHLQNIVALCDVDRDHLAIAKNRVSHQVAEYSDYRRLLDNRDVDAVLIGTPDHWHALTTINAIQAGKDVYCEKPLTLTIAEGRAVVRAAARHHRIVQTGSMQRSERQFRQACELVRNGKLGAIRTVRVGLAGVNYTGGIVPDSEPPAGLNYDLWLGPAPQRRYNVNRVHYKFRFFWDYAGGQMTNWGAHHLDIAQWGLGMDATGPVTIEANTVQFNAKHEYEVPQTFEVTYTYANGVRVICANRGIRGGCTFEGSRGKLEIDRGHLVCDPPELLRQELGANDTHLYASNSHSGNWLECIRNRRAPICDAEIGHRSATVCHLGNIACRVGVGLRLTWDPAKEEFVGNAAAQAMVRRTYRAPWVLPLEG